MDEAAFEDVERARVEHREWAQKFGFFLILLGLGGLIAALIMGLAHDFWVSRDIDPLIWGAPAAVALFAFVGAGYFFYSSQPVPNEPLHAPVALDLATDQAWRKPTRLRFLERLKEEASSAERKIQQAHNSAALAYRSISSVVSYPEYRRTKAELQENEFIKKLVFDQLPTLYERIDKIFGGDLGTEILNIKEQIKKIRRENVECQSIMAENQAKVDRCTTPDCERCKAWPDQKERLRNTIYRNDHRIIELETDLEELENFDFRQMWKDLDLPGPPDLSRVPHDRILDMKTKVETLNSIPSLKNRMPQQSPEELNRQKREACEQKIAELKSNMVRDIAKADNEPERHRIKNFYNDRIASKQEEWSKYL